ncbi:conserved hypothetical protein [Paecilomyces variotii No. 5]|uniref:Transcription factor domain-containing protein n=1 Tax=Byssochlamys spectabilis (strain No. 5 / NBRC 109023) TaxID=1356009 RepID=V5G9C0_BYSSN|nr:conserved hypothetical protein [Paecilomyces variotii No. 5]
MSCTVDPTFHRINKEDHIRQLEGHIRELRDLVGKKDETTSSTPVSNLSITVPEALTSENPDMGLRDGSARDILPDLESVQELPRHPSQSTYSIGPVTLSHEQADTLVALYFNKYHHFLPFLDPSKGAEDYYKTSRLLFWSLISVSSRQFRTDPHLLMKLAPILNNALWKTVATGSISFSHLQALVINSCWLLPKFRLWTDKSLVFANIAVTYATHLGLHRPGHEQDYTKDNISLTHRGVLERMKTWLACTSLYQSLTIDVGQPPLLLLMNKTISQFSGEEMASEIPPELYHNSLIQECSYRATYTLSENSESTSGIPPPGSFYLMMDMLEESFDLLQQNLGDTISFFNNLRLTAARLIFQCNYFLEETQTERRMKGILRAYSTAVLLITTTISHEVACEELPYAPLSSLRMIFLAALVIFRVLHSKYAASPYAELDKSAGHVLYRAASLALRQLSVQCDEKDIPTRASDVLNELWRWGESDIDLQRCEPTFRVRSRMGGSLLFDCLFIWRKYKRKSHQQSAPQSSQFQNQDSADLSRSQFTRENFLVGSMEIFDPSIFAPSIFDSTGICEQAEAWDYSEDPSLSIWQA